MDKLTGKERTRLAKLKIGEASFWSLLPKKSRKLLNFSKFEYKGRQVKSIVICPIHGELEMRPDNLMQGKGCKECGRSANGKSKQVFISRIDLKALCKKAGVKILDRQSRFRVYGNLNILCPIHGETTTRVKQLMEKESCGKCSKSEGLTKHFSSNAEDFIHKAKEIHGKLYSYSKVVYITAKTKVTLGCREHGAFEITPNNHLSGRGCTACGNAHKQLERNGKTFLLQGYEPQALDYMISKGLRVEDIECYQSKKVPSIRTNFKLKDHVHKIHRPDFFIPRLNQIVEVKSLGTMGFETRHNSWSYSPNAALRLMQHKSKRAKAQGYKYVCLLMTRQGNRIRLPNGWDTMGVKDLRKEVLTRYRNL